MGVYVLNWGGGSAEITIGIGKKEREGRHKDRCVGGAGSHTHRDRAVKLSYSAEALPLHQPLYAPPLSAFHAFIRLPGPLGRKLL